MRANVHKLLILAKAEPKQSITLGVVTVVALGLWARAATQSGSRAMADGGGVADTTLEDREQSSRASRETVVIDGAHPITRDLFTPRPEDFPPPVQTEPITGAASKSATGSDDKTNEANSLPQLTPEARVLAESGALTLRSTVVGADPIAVIEVRRSGSPERAVLRIGDSVLGFRLVRVVNRHAVVEKDGVEVKLTLPMH